MEKKKEKNTRMVELYFNNNQLSGIDIFEPQKKKAPGAPGWYRVGAYEYDVALDIAHLYLQIPFKVRKTLGEPEIGEKYWGTRDE